MNKTILIGRLTDDPKSNEYTDGKVTRYSLAVDRRGQKKGADYINVTVFGKGAEFAANFFRKGMRVAVEGHLHSDSYVNREGTKIYTMELIADSQEFADGRRDE